MDVPEADFDIKLQKISGDLISEIDNLLSNLFQKHDSSGALKVRPRVRAREVDRLTGSLLDQFQELPQLLDPHLPRWLPFLSETYLEHLRSGRRGKHRPEQSQFLVTAGHAICKILYTFCKIRGEKVIVRFLNVETKYLELLLTAFEEAEQHAEGDDPAERWTWEQRYIVLLWLSHLLLAPFDLSTISSMDLEDVTGPEIPGLDLPKGLPGITLRLVPLAVKYLASPGKERDGAKALLARMAMRRDMQQLRVLDSLVRWSLSSLQRPQGEGPETVYYYLGVLSFLAGILKSSSHTSDMEPFLASIFHAVNTFFTAETEVSKTITSFALARKMILKVVRSVIVTLLRKPTQDMASTESTEGGIAYLLERLGDTDTPVRLAASKSLSIITLKLDSDMASQVVEAVLEALSFKVLWRKDASGRRVKDLAAVNHLEWHGLILTLSHLLYRRSPPAEQLSDIIHALLLGLSFEQRNTSGTSVGANVRDAACFGVWALARRYTSEELLAVPVKSGFTPLTASESTSKTQDSKSMLQVLATELVTSASLDPAGNIRRGASAALQELVGRHPDTVEKGIWVVQTVDYHAVARRSRAMKDVAQGVTKVSADYGVAIADGIRGWRGIGDPDPASRRAAADSYGVLSFAARKAPNGAEQLNASLDELIQRLEALDERQVEERHGLVLCMAAVFDQLPLASRGSNEFSTSWAEGAAQLLLNKMKNLLDKLQSTSSRRPELIAEAGSRLVMSMVPLLQAIVFQGEPPGSVDVAAQFFSPSASPLYQHIAAKLEETTAPEYEAVQSFTAVLEKLLPAWLMRNDPEVMAPASYAAFTLLVFSKLERREAILESWATAVRNKPTSRASPRGDGYFHALTSAQPLARMASGSNVVCDAILGRWAADPEVETRVAILQSLARSHILSDKPLVFLKVLADGLNDYTNTTRGDIGSLVRLQALKAVQVMWQDIRDPAGEVPWLEASLKVLFYSVLRLSAEKLDRVRPEAQVALSLAMKRGYVDEFATLTFSSQAYFNTLLNLIHADCMIPALDATAEKDTSNWVAHLLSGYVTSADTGNEDLVIASRAALTEFCEASAENLDIVCAALIQNLKLYQVEDRIIVPTLEMVAFLFHVGLFQRSRSVNMRSLCLQAQKASYKASNIRKIEACVKVYGGVAAGGNGASNDGIDEAAGQEARKRLGALLFHPWPRVRIMVVDEVWNLIGEDEEHGQRLMGVDWGKADRAEIKSAIGMLRLE